MEKIITLNDLVYLFRIFLAILAGAVIGYEREQRYKVAGLRTHILISMAAALMMIISKYAFFDVLRDYEMAGIRVDVSRVAAGIIAGMGILSGGIVFIGKRGNVSGVTTAAGIWATIGIGMVIGSGMYAVGIGSVIFVEIVQIMLHHDFSDYRHQINASVSFELNDMECGYAELEKKLKQQNAKMSSIKWEKQPDGTALLRCYISFDNRSKREEVVSFLNGIEEVKSFELP